MRSKLLLQRRLLCLIVGQDGLGDDEGLPRVEQADVAAVLVEGRHFIAGPLWGHLACLLFRGRIEELLIADALRRKHVVAVVGVTIQLQLLVVTIDGLVSSSFGHFFY